MNFSLSKDAVQDVTTPCLLVGIFEDTALDGSAAKLDEASGGRFSELIRSGDVGPDRGELTLLHGLPGSKPNAYSSPVWDCLKNSVEADSMQPAWPRASCCATTP